MFAGCPLHLAAQSHPRRHLLDLFAVLWAGRSPCADLRRQDLHVRPGWVGWLRGCPRPRRHHLAFLAPTCPAKRPGLGCSGRSLASAPPSAVSASHEFWLSLALYLRGVCRTSACRPPPLVQLMTPERCAGAVTGSTSVHRSSNEISELRAGLPRPLRSVAAAAGGGSHLFWSRYGGLACRRCARAALHT